MSSPSANTMLTVRPATPSDAGACGRICYDAFTKINRDHGFPPELPAPEAGVGLLEMLFSHPGFYCVVAESEGKIVGSNCLDERGAIAGLGPITVDPDVQNRGVGRILMLAAMDRARERSFPSVRLLQSAFHNRSLSLYVKLGFDVREPMSVMHGPPIQNGLEGCSVRPAVESDLDAANALCEKVHGHNRAGELREAIGQGSARIVDRQGRLTGYAAGFGYFGHAVGESNLDVQALIASASTFEGPGIIVPTRNAELLRWCLDHGLRIFQPMTLMTMGLYNEPAGAYLPSVLY
jgi:GNAT superfamily N-acetyltransferase